MACDLETTQAAACESGIGKVGSPISLLQLIAQLSCEIADAGGGGGGTPSAPLNSVQFNNAGAFGGSADLTFNDATNLLSLNGTVVIPGTGAYSSSGALNISPAAGMNVNANLSAGGRMLATGDIQIYDDTRSFAFGLGTLFDVTLFRDAADALALSRSTNAQTFRVYRTFTNSTNYERLAIQSAAGQMILAAETAGTGTNDLDLVLTPAGAGEVQFSLPALNTAVDGGATAAFTANMVASTGGPATAAQHGWLRVKDSTGATTWIPVWK